MTTTAPSTMTQAIYSDGRTAAQHPGRVELAPAGVRFTADAGTPSLFWRFEEIRRVRPYHPREHIALRRDDVSGERLVLTDPAVVAAFEAAAPSVVRPPKFGRDFAARWSSIIGSLVLAGVVIWYLLPWAAGAVAAALPQSLLENVGAGEVRSIASQFGTCGDAAGRAALDRLVDRLTTTAGLSRGVATTIIDTDLPNAFALPGHHMLITSGLLHRIGSAEALAGVVAHELGHLAYRHPTRLYIQRGLVSTLVSAVTGGGQYGIGIDGLAGLAVVLSYSREAEREADLWGIDLMNRADIDGRPLAGFFDKIGEVDEGRTSVLQWLSTHPADAERRDRVLTTSTGRGQAMPGADWRAVREMCPEKKKRRDEESD